MRQGVLHYPLDRLEVVRAGSGAPRLLLLHGWGGDAHTLLNFCEPIAQHRELLALSLPGFGDSPEPDSVWGTWEYAAVVERWLELHDLAPVDVIGHSFGGRVAIGLAAGRPELVGRLVLMASAGLKPSRSLKIRWRLLQARMLKTVAGLLGGALAERIRRRRERLGSADWRAASPVMRGVLGRVVGEDLNAVLPDLRTNTLLVWGDADTETPLRMGRRMARSIPGARLDVLPGAGHYPFLDRPGEVLSELWRHLDLPDVWNR